MSPACPGFTKYGSRGYSLLYSSGERPRLCASAVRLLTSAIISSLVAVPGFPVFAGPAATASADLLISSSETPSPSLSAASVISFSNCASSSAV